MSKAGQITVWVIVAFMLALGLAIAWVVTDLDNIGKGTIEVHGSAATGTTVNVANVDTSLRGGEVSIRGLQIGNPEGYETEYALRVDAIDVALNVSTSTSDTVVVDRLLIDGARMIAEYRGTENSNLSVIFGNLERYSGGAPSGQDYTQTVRFVIGEFRFSGGELRVVNDKLDVDKTIVVPEFTVTDIGRQGLGATVAQVRRRLLQPIIQRALGALQTGTPERVREEFDRQLREIGHLLGGVQEGEEQDGY